MGFSAGVDSASAMSSIGTIARPAHSVAKHTRAESKHIADEHRSAGIASEVHGSLMQKRAVS